MISKKQNEDYIFDEEKSLSPISRPCVCCIAAQGDCYKCILSEFDAPDNIYATKCGTWPRIAMNITLPSLYFEFKDHIHAHELRMLELICLRDYWRERV